MVLQQQAPPAAKKKVHRQQVGPTTTSPCCLAVATSGMCSTAAPLHRNQQAPAGTVLLPHRPQRISHCFRHHRRCSCASTARGSMESGSPRSISPAAAAAAAVIVISAAVSCTGPSPSQLKKLPFAHCLQRQPSRHRRPAHRTPHLHRQLLAQTPHQGA